MKKKLLCFLVTSLLVLTSCSNDDNNGTIEPVKVITPKSITYQGENGENIDVNTLIYNGNKIVSASCLAYGRIMKTVFTYTGNLITKTEGFTDDQLFSTTLYTYDNGKLKEESYFLPTQLEDAFYYKKVYTHNSDNTISYKVYRHENPAEPEDGIHTLTFTNGNLVKSKTEYSDLNPYYKYVYEYKYDNKNNPLKNILGLDLILLEGGVVSGHDMFNGDFGINDFGLNNISEKITTVTSEVGVETYVEKLTYKYDENGYPTKKSSDQFTDVIGYNY
ncbi:hypothetical protein [Flavobacterium sp. C3NV]|uniref:hypothetical protein n=1 Tax=Flavobacterium sp. C3NV TaxID=3393358 RepID=UPI00398FA8FA